MDQNPDLILQRLEQLRLWQEEQQNALFEKQMAQRELLNLEKYKLYEMFGLSMTSTIPNESGTTSCNETHMDPELLKEIHAENGNTLDFICENPNSPANNAGVIEKKQETPKKTVSFGKQPDKTHTDDAIPSEINENQPEKRPFLRRGEGLQSRFRVNPETLRLNNLPKYKFAGAHRKSRFFRDPIKKLRVKPPAPKDNDNDPIKHDVCRSPPPSEKLTANTWTNVLDPNSAPFNRPRGNVSIQDTPTREIIRKQQQELEELDVFEQIEENINRFPENSEQYNVYEVSASETPANNDTTIDSSFHGVSYIDQPTKPGKVRFMSQVQLNEATAIFSDCDTAVSTDLENANVNHTSTPNTRNAFQTFKSQLFGEPTLSDTTIMADSVQHVNVANRDPPPLAAAADSLAPMRVIQQQSDEMKNKLSELEIEIDRFRAQNAALTKAQQQLELDRAQVTAEREEVDERLGDERIKMEVYLHDERMKILADREALDRRAKELRGPNRREREETTQLKERVDALEKELASKEQKHVAAQARLRAQLRTMEKDLKEFVYEMDNMKKDNKKLEAENVRLRRQSNNKMLSEINRNIARLAVDKTKDGETEAPEKIVQKPAERLNKTANATGKCVGKSGMAKTRTRSVPNLVEPASKYSSTASNSSDSEVDDSPKTSSHYFQPSSSSKENVSPVHQSSSPRLIENAPPRPDTNHTKREIVNADGSRDVLYPNGNLKKISADTMRIRMLYYNKDIKETNIGEGTVKYYYAETNTWHTTYLDGLEILEFPNGQTEHRFKDGRIEVHFANGSIRLTDPRNTSVQEEWRYPDGTQVVQKSNGEKVLSLPNGQREVHTEQHKRREYPDGTVKIVYADGSQETRYSNGRVRLKDKTGNLVMDSEGLFAPKQTK